MHFLTLKSIVFGIASHPVLFSRPFNLTELFPTAEYLIPIETVQSHKYFGTWNYNDHNKEITTRIETVRQAFIKKNKMFTNRNLSMKIKML